MKDAYMLPVKRSQSEFLSIEDACSKSTVGLLSSEFLFQPSSRRKVVDRPCEIGDDSVSLGHEGTCCTSASGIVPMSTQPNLDDVEDPAAAIAARRHDLAKRAANAGVIAALRRAVCTW